MVKLSFAHAEGRNYRQLPDTARLREKPSPADIFYLIEIDLSRLACKCRDAFFGTGVQAQRSLGFDYARGSGIDRNGQPSSYLNCKAAI